MLKNYLKIALRNLRNYKAYSLINILGLSIGMACCMILIVFVRHEYSFDRHHEHAEQVYRIDTRANIFGRELIWTYTQEPFTSTVKNDFPEVIYSSHFDRARNIDIRIEDRVVREENFFWANQDILEIFTFEILQGEKTSLLSRPNTVIITDEMAAKHYPDIDPIGKTFYIDTTAYEITGIIKPQPVNSHFHANFIASYLTFPEAEIPRWFNFSTRTYVRLQDGITREMFAAKLPDFIERHFGEKAREFGYQYEYIPKPLLDIHLHSNIRGELEANGNINYVYIMSIIAAFILAIACINFMNLSTARAGRRAKEIGLRKVMGAYKRRLIAQFLGESLLISLLSFGLSFLLIRLFLPTFNLMAGREIAFSSITDPLLFLPFLGIVLIAGIGAGLYPAFYLTRFQPAQVFRGNATPAGAASIIRKGLVVLQFSISICLVIGALIINTQLDFMRNKDLGFAKDHVVVIPLKTADVINSAPALKQELKNQSRVVNVTGANHYPGTGYMTWDHWPEGAGDDAGISIDAAYISYDYFETMELPIIEGRGFSKDFSTDLEESVMINVTAARMLGFDDEAIGKMMYTAGPSREGRTGRKIIGVFQDFNAGSLRNEIKPLIVYPRESTRNLLVRIEANNIQAGLAQLESSFATTNPGMPYEYRFMDDMLNNFYNAEQNLSEIINTFTVLAIFIACLGLVGLISFTVEQRRKEIGIRKVLGASTSSIVGILSREFSRLVILANVIAWPLAYYAMQRWLEDFAYRTEIHFSIFLWSGILGLGIALATISFQTIKAALANPVQALRSE